MDRLARDDLRLPEPLPQRLHPEGVRDAIPVDERDRLAPGVLHTKVPALAPCPALQQQVDDRILLFIRRDDLPGPVRAVRVDDEDLQRSVLCDEAIEEVLDVPLLI